MKLQFTHRGQPRQLVKHPEVQRELARHQITAQAAARRPWYLRLTIKGKDRPFPLPWQNKSAIIKAKELLTKYRDDPNTFSAWLAERDARRAVTLRQLATPWLEAGLPKTIFEPREPAAAEHLRKVLQRALNWWGDKPVATITRQHHGQFVAWRQQTTAYGAGNRSADLELSALSCLCRWAVSASKIQANPFSSRDTYAKAETHCHEHSPINDDHLHKTLRWLYDGEDRHQVLVAAWLTFCALTGLRPNEPGYLLRLPPCATAPEDEKTLQPGQIFPDLTGTLRMRIRRSKRGQNPYLTITPALEQFLSAWRAYHSRHYADSEKLFPMQISLTCLNRYLNLAAKALEQPRYTPHGIGRAYYVRVRRSQKATDLTIAAELGQTSQGQLIRRVYGDPDQLVGGQLLDWLPTEGAPAWTLLNNPRYGRDTATPPQDTAGCGGIGQPVETRNPLPPAELPQKP